MIKNFLRRQNIKADGLPVLLGRWPNIHNEGKMCIGANCSFVTYRFQQTFVVRANAELEIGHDSFFSDGVSVCATQSIRIGHHAKLGPRIDISDYAFHQVSPDAPTRCAPVIIGNNVWIRANSMILPGAVIGDHAVIGVSSIVTGEIPAKCLAVGNPARVIKTLHIPDDWLRK